MSKQEAPVLWLSCEGQIDVWDMFSDNSYLSAILVRQGLKVAAPVDLRTKKTESFSPQLLQGFWHKLKKKNPKIVVLSPDCWDEELRKEVVWQQCQVCMDVAEHQILGVKHPSHFGKRSRTDLVVEKGAMSPEISTICQWTLLRGKKPKWSFHNIGNLLRPLELVPASRERVFSYRMASTAQLSEIAYSRAKVIPAQAPQYRQYALISDFLDLADLSTQEEAAVATNWIKDRPEGLKLQNLTLATRKGRSTSTVPENLTADVHYAINKCESLGSGKQLILHGNPSAIARDFSPHMAVLRRHCLPNVHFQCCMFLQGTLGHDFDIFAASGGSTALGAPLENPFKTNWR